MRGLPSGSQDPWPFSALWPWEKHTPINEIPERKDCFVCFCESTNWTLRFSPLITNSQNKTCQANKTPTPPPSDVSQNMPSSHNCSSVYLSIMQKNPNHSTVLSERERERVAKEGKPQRPLPLSPLTCKQASGEREGEKRGRRTHPFHWPVVHQGASQEQ